MVFGGAPSPKRPLREPAFVIKSVILSEVPSRSALAERDGTSLRMTESKRGEVCGGFSKAASRSGRPPTSARPSCRCARWTPPPSSGIGIYRRFGRPDFTDREIRITHIILKEVPWLHEQGWPEDRGATVHQLARRQRMALNLLIAGQGRKQIADHMKISVNTVHEYIKDIYDFFGVHSQAELMSRFYEGNGHDRL